MRVGIGRFRPRGLGAFMTLFTIVLTAGCQHTGARPEEMPSAESWSLSHVELYTNGDVTMDDAGRIYIYRDSNPNVAESHFPGLPGYELAIELARGLKPGERKRIYTSNGWYRKNDDGSYTVEGLLVSAGGASAIARRHIKPDDPEHACMDQLLGAPTTGVEYAYLSYFLDQIHACVTGGEPPPKAPEQAAQNPSVRSR